MRNNVACSKLPTLKTNGSVWYLIGVTAEYLILKHAGGYALTNLQVHIIGQVTAEISVHVGVTKTHSAGWKMLAYAQ